MITCLVPIWRIVNAAFFGNDFLDQSGTNEKIVDARVFVGSFPVVRPVFAAAVAEPQVHHMVRGAFPADDFADWVFVFRVIQISEQAANLRLERLQEFRSMMFAQTTAPLSPASGLGRILERPDAI